MKEWITNHKQNAHEYATKWLNAEYEITRNIKSTDSSLEFLLKEGTAVMIWILDL